MFEKVIGPAAFLLALMTSTTGAEALCSSYPYTLTNGATADATQVMADFNCAALTSGPTINAATFTGATAFPGSTNITGAGHLLVNTTTDFGLLVAIGNGSGNLGYLRSNSTADKFLQFISTATGASTMAFFEVYGATVGSIVSDNYSTTYNTTSDQRLKDWQIRQKNYADTIRNIWVGDFKWKKGGAVDFGVRAQQAYALFPTAIHKPQNDREMWQADYGKFAPLALWGVKDLYKTTDDQARKIAEMQRDMKLLMVQVSELHHVNQTATAEIGRLRAQLDGSPRKTMQTAQN